MRNSSRLFAHFDAYLVKLMFGYFYDDKNKECFLI